MFKLILTNVKFFKHMYKCIAYQEISQSTGKFEKKKLNYKEVVHPIAFVAAIWCIKGPK